MKGFKLPPRNFTLFVLAFGMLALFVPIVLIETNVLHYTNGVFMYPLDDTFIHLEISQNLVKGNWGVNENEFASTSSSLLYTILLTIFRFFSSDTILPFLINCLAGILIIWALHLWLNRHQVNPVAQVLIILLVIFFTPLPTMIVSGMEHTIQCLLSFLFIFYFSDWLEKNKNTKGARLPWSLLIYAILLGSIRYEGLFLIAIAGALLIYYKKLKLALVLGLTALLPVIVFGIYSVSMGSYFLPNSVLVKSETNTTGLLEFISTVLLEKLTYAKSGMAALATQRWVLILPLAYLVFKKHLRPSHSFILIFLIVATILQLSLAATGWLYRYEAYLFFCSTVIVSLLFYKYGREILGNLTPGLRIVAAIFVFFLFFPIVLRSITALLKANRACKNIYEQQYQMARFSKKYYNSDVIAANDIGAISYFTDSKVIDLWGLASIEVARSRQGRYCTPGFLDSLCRSKGVRIAIIYDSWFPDSLTNRWKKAATWQIQNNVICGDDVVSIYSIDISGYDSLSKNLRDFQPLLPSTVRVRYY